MMNSQTTFTIAEQDYEEFRGPDCLRLGKVPLAVPMEQRKKLSLNTIRGIGGAVWEYTLTAS